MNYFTSAKVTNLLRNIVSVRPSAKSGSLKPQNAGYNIKSRPHINASDSYQNNLSCYEFGSVATMFFIIGQKNGRHWLNTLESELRFLWHHESQWELCWSKDHKEIGPGHVLMQMSIVFLTSVDLLWLIPDEAMRWFGCAVPSWKAVERCSEISAGPASPEANTQPTVFPLNRHGRGKSSSISHCAGAETGSGESTKNSGVLSARQFGREAIKAVLSDRDRKNTLYYLRSCRAPLCSLPSENICFCAPLDGFWDLPQQELKCICLGVENSKDEVCSKCTQATAVEQPSQLQ